MDERDIGFRAWFYFRNGWSIYFAFIFAAINTLTVTFYLAIERMPFLQTIFPTFLHYILIVGGIGVPLLILIGFVHWKRSSARKAEIDIGYETDPYKARTLVNTEILLKINLQLTSLLIKFTNNMKLNEEELKQIKTLQDELTDFLEKRTLSNKLDLKYIKTETEEKSSND
ncbi:hypothetical protein [Nitrosopumilus sp.]|uniref:hypothetical protein n=1 Tax=Nitrosopumilus sp. TaxID=2024843 RepID=UPI003D0D06F6